MFIFWLGGKVTRTILANVTHNDKKIEICKRLYSDPLKCYHPCWRLFQNVSSLLQKHVLQRFRVSPRRPRKPSTAIRLILRWHIWTFSYTDQWARSAQNKFWPDDCMAVRPCAGGKWAHNATMDGRLAGRAASGQSRKPQKKTTGPRLYHDVATSYIAFITIWIKRHFIRKHT